MLRQTGTILVQQRLPGPEDRARIEVQLPGVYKNEEINRVPIICTGGCSGSSVLQASLEKLAVQCKFVVAIVTIFACCALTIFAVHVLEMRFADMGDDGCYAHTLQTHLHQVHLEMLPQDPDPVEKLILQDARQWLSALAQQRPIRPALIGAGLRLGR